MNLEQAILDRLEKRNAQIAQLQSTVHALERAADSQREHAMTERGLLLEENQKLADRIERIEESKASDDIVRKSLNEEITERDRELREMDAEAKAHREAIQKKDAEIQEWLMQLANARNERDAALREAESLRSQVPLESTREALKNAVAKLQEEKGRAHKNQVKADALASIREFAESCGMMSDESVKAFIQRKCVELEEVRIDFKEEERRCETAVAKLQEATARADNLATCRNRWMKIAADCGRMDGEDAGEFIARLAQQSAQGVELAVKVEELRVVNIKQEKELEELRAFAKAAVRGSHLRQ